MYDSLLGSTDVQHKSTVIVGLNFARPNRHRSARVNRENRAVNALTDV